MNKKYVYFEAEPGKTQDAIIVKHVSVKDLYVIISEKENVIDKIISDNKEYVEAKPKRAYAIINSDKLLSLLQKDLFINIIKTDIVNSKNISVVVDIYGDSKIIAESEYFKYFEISSSHNVEISMKEDGLFIKGYYHD